MTGWTIAVLAETVMLPFEPVEVTGIKTATGVVWKVVGGVGEGVMLMLLDAGAGVFGTAGTSSFADSKTSGAWSIGGA